MNTIILCILAVILVAFLSISLALLSYWDFSNAKNDLAFIFRLFSKVFNKLAVNRKQRKRAFEKKKLSTRYSYIVKLREKLEVFEDYKYEGKEVKPNAINNFMYSHLIYLFSDFTNTIFQKLVGYNKMIKILINSIFNFNSKMLSAEDVGAVIIRNPKTNMQYYLSRIDAEQTANCNDSFGIDISIELLNKAIFNDRKVTAEEFAFAGFSCLINSNIYFNTPNQIMSFLRNVNSKTQYKTFIKHFNPQNLRISYRVKSKKSDEKSGRHIFFEECFRGAVDDFFPKLFGNSISPTVIPLIEPLAIDPLVHFGYACFRNLSMCYMDRPPKINAQLEVDASNKCWEVYENLWEKLAKHQEIQDEKVNILNFIVAFEDFVRVIFVQCRRDEIIPLRRKIARVFQATYVDSEYYDLDGWLNLAGKISTFLNESKAEKKNITEIEGKKELLSYHILMNRRQNRRIFGFEQVSYSDDNGNNVSTEWKLPIWDVMNLINSASSNDAICQLIAIFLSKYNIAEYDRIIGVGGGGTVIGSLFSLIFGKPLSIIAVTPSVELKPMPSILEKVLIIDDVMQSKFTINVVLESLRSKGYCIEDEDVFTVCKCISGTGINNMNMPLVPFDSLIRIEDGSMSAIEYGLNSSGRVNTITDESVPFATNKAILKDIRNRLVNWANKIEFIGEDNQKLANKIRKTCNVEGCYDDSLLFNNPSLVLEISKHIYGEFIIKSKDNCENFNIIVALTKAAIPIVIGMGLINKFLVYTTRDISTWIINPNRNIIAGLSNRAEDAPQNALVFDTVNKTGRTFESFQEAAKKLNVSISRYVSIFDARSYHNTTHIKDVETSAIVDIE